MSPQRVFLWAQLAMARNRLRRQIARLRSPRYAIALFVGLLYFWFIFLGPASVSREPASGAPVSAELEILAAIGLAMLTAWWWLRGGYQTALAFSPAEVHFLFPAPLLRRHLIQFKLLRSQLPLLFSALLFSLIFARTQLPFPMRFVGLWLLIANIHLHQIGASLARAGAEQRGTRTRALLPLGIALAAFAVLAGSVAAAMPQIRTAADMDAALAHVVGALSAPAPAAVLLPFQIALEPTLARTMDAWLAGLPGAALLLALHYLWVMRSDAAFEEAAADAGARQAARMAAARAGRRAPVDARGRAAARPRRTLLPLASSGAPALAITWKNVIAFSRNLTRSTAIVIVFGIGVVFVALVFSSGSVADAADAMVVMTGLYTAFIVFVGPLTVRNDLRTDLGRLDALKTLPLRGRDLVAAEVAAATATLAAMQLGLLLVGFGFAPFGAETRDHLPAIWAAVSVAVLLLPALNALFVTLHNGFALLLPGWVRIGTQPGGAEFMGQLIVLAAGTFILAAVALIPPLLFGGYVATASRPLYGAWSIAPAAVGFLLALWAEIALLIRWLGGVYDRLDAADAGIITA